MIIKFIALITKSTLLITILINLFIGFSFLLFSRYRSAKQSADKLTLELNNRIINLKNAFSTKLIATENSSQYLSRDNLGVTDLSSWLHSNWENFDDQQRKNYSVAVVKNADKMVNFMNNILDFATLNEENYYLKIETIDLTSLILERVQECSKIYQNRNKVDFHYDLEPKVFVKGDKYFIKQAIDSLIINALNRSHCHIYIKLALTQASPSNSFEGEKDSKAVEFIIQDQNKPFNKATIAYFSQKNALANLKLDSTKDINLALCKKIIEVHNGFIEVIGIKSKSELGFKFLLPIQ